MTTESPVKRQLHAAILPQSDLNGCQGALSTMGMRIRQSVDRGYQTPQSLSAPVSSPSHFSNVCMQDNSNFTIPEYKRVPLSGARQAPMLVNERTVSSSSSLAMWESQLDERLEHIDNDIMRNKLGAGDLMMGVKRGFDQVSEW
ncbi:LAMI_0H01508g1_1 [Lachancea mirantina]|uniref:Damage-regulated import facilitator 1 n=1 Tax=Lachancea mirantina TaxID=1230905 RepID=A0A1G4KE36_9SACH|nr:LAMI_0H01508g1_1 [Lachancea mirantina]